jgi:haloalkane dehalogenase
MISGGHVGQFAWPGRLSRHPWAEAYHAWLLDTEIPKLFFWAEPGSIISPARAAWLQARLKACKTVGLGPGRHFLQEDHADVIGRQIADWVSNSLALG